MKILEPTGNRILVIDVIEETVTNSGLILAANTKERPQMGQIIAWGDKVDNPQLKVMEQKIMYPKYAGVSVKLDEKNYLILEELDVIALVREV